MAGLPIVILGAGATKACNGPLTAEILPIAFTVLAGSLHRQRLKSLRSFLVDHFFLNPDKKRLTNSDFPDLSTLISLIDTAVDRKQDFSANWRSEELVAVRESIDWAIFAVIMEMLGRVPPHHSRMLERIFAGQTSPRIVSLNYDIIVDNTLTSMGMDRGNDGQLSEMASFPDYGCEFQTEGYLRSMRWGELYKLHGSMNWIYCPNCGRMDLAISRSGLRTTKAVNQLFMQDRIEQRMKHRQRGCRNCEARVRPILISPSHLKDYRNPHLRQVWFKAEQALRESERAYFIGYSLPSDDVDVAYLLKRGLAHLPGSAITVVEFDKQKRSARNHPVGQRFRQLFGPRIKWFNAGMEKWVETL